MKRIAVAVAALASLGTLAGCGQYTPPPTAEPPAAKEVGSDPKKGWVLLWDEPDPEYQDEIYIRCFGEELILQTDDDRGSSWSSEIVPHPLCK